MTARRRPEGIAHPPAWPLRQSSPRSAYDPHVWSLRNPATPPHSTDRYEALALAPTRERRAARSRPAWNRPTVRVFVYTWFFLYELIGLAFLRQSLVKR